MKLYDALSYLSDAGYGGWSASIYLRNGPGVMMKIDDALDGTGVNPILSQKVEDWYDNDVIYEPYIENDNRWVLCVGWDGANNSSPSWNGFFTYEELRELQQAEENCSS